MAITPIATQGWNIFRGLGKVVLGGWDKGLTLNNGLKFVIFSSSAFSGTSNAASSAMDLARNNNSERVSIRAFDEAEVKTGSTSAGLSGLALAAAFLPAWHPLKIFSQASVNAVAMGSIGMDKYVRAMSDTCVAQNRTGPDSDSPLKQLIGRIYGGGPTDRALYASDGSYLPYEIVAKHFIERDAKEKGVTTPFYDSGEARIVSLSDPSKLRLNDEHPYQNVHFFFNAYRNVVEMLT
jgi:hypothetical protein